jgi:hypothetical protein
MREAIATLTDRTIQAVDAIECLANFAGAHEGRLERSKINKESLSRDPRRRADYLIGITALGAETPPMERVTVWLPDATEGTVTLI